MPGGGRKKKKLKPHPWDKNLLQMPPDNKCAYEIHIIE